MEQLIKLGHVAQLVEVEGEEGKLEWKGEKDWPVFIGYPFARVDDIVVKEKIGGQEVERILRAPQLLGDLPWELEPVRKDDATHCWIYIRTDV